MKPTDFITENQHLVQDADDMYKDNEVQMARSDCYNAAKYAIELHKMLKSFNEITGLEAWVSEKITLANDYLRTVHEYLSYELQSQQESEPAVFDAAIAESKMADLLDETTSSASIATVPAAGAKNAGTLFGGSYSPKSPFKKKSVKKEEIIKR